MKKHLFRWMAAAALVALVAACSAPGEPAADWTTWEDGYAEYAALAAADGGIGLASTTEPQRYILSQNGALRGVERAAARRGDTLRVYLPDAGFAVVETRDPGAYARFANVIVRDLVVSWREPTEVVAFEAEVGDPPFSGSADFFFDLQWGHVPVRATAAWAAGVTGAGARVAVIDGGFDLDHPDLVPNINFDLSQNFVAGEDLEYGLPDTFSHGSHVAGTVAAAQNDFGVIGVAPDAELVLLKALGDGGSGSFGDVGAAMLYAADVGADIANMSLGATLFQSGDAEEGYTARDVAALRVFMQRAANYATQKGTLVIASAGNDAIDFDKDADLLKLPAALAHVVSVSATAPVGWATDPQNADFDRLASYSNFGRSGIDVSAPGGDFFYPGNEGCTVAGLLRPCWVFDLVFSTGNGGWYWSAGTSMAAPHASGVAALILSEHGGSGSMTPAQLERALIERAADLGLPGRDPVHGKGAVQSGY